MSIVEKMLPNKFYPTQGGPAFPFVYESDPDPDFADATKKITVHFGMSLRDYFAACVLGRAPMSREELDEAERMGVQAMADAYALAAYRMADAMLNARDVK